jgi:hypothetical protein
VKARFKIAILIFIISLILPIVAFKLKAPEFLNSLEKRIANFQEPSEIQVAERKSFYVSNLNDPFKLSERVKILSKATGLSQEYNELLMLSMIYKGKRKYVQIGDKIVKEGERFGNFRVMKILEDKVLIKDKKGEKKWLKVEG